MAQVTVTIAGQSYRMACAEGEERHLEGLAAAYDGKIRDMRAAFGEIGDLRLHVMAALTLADEAQEAKRRVAALETQLAVVKALAATDEGRARLVESRLAEGVQRAADKIERLARSLNSSGQ